MFAGVSDFADQKNAFLIVYTHLYKSKHGTLLKVKQVKLL